jgi:hypothetical protein
MAMAGTASAQSSLTAPNNSAGSPLDTPPLVVPPPTAGPTSNSNLPSRSDSSGAAFQKLDQNGNGYVSRSDFARMGGGNFDAADTNGDGRLSYDEFQRYWTEVQSGKD